MVGGHDVGETMEKYKIAGTVVHGKALGRTVGMPTMNLQTEMDVSMVPSGVYASMARLRGKTYRGLTSIGQRPTVDDEKHRTIETYLLDFSDDIYGEEVILELHSFIREIRKFDSIQKVKEQVQKDIKAAYTFLE